jgi:hypothetical protein
LGGGDTVYNIIYGVDFSNASEGIADLGLGNFMTTVDTGKHWKQMQFPGVSFFHSYGSEKFRAVYPDGTVFTTNNNWETIDTSSITNDGPFSDASVMPYSVSFGQGDTLAMTGYRWDSTGTHLLLVLGYSTNAGAHWSAPLFPENVSIYPSTISPIDQQTIVIAGTDSLQRIIISTDRGATWNVDTVPFDDGNPYYRITSVAVTGSGRVLASIIPDSNYIGSNCLAYLEPVSSSVAQTVSPHQIFTIFPNPAKNEIQVSLGVGNISILDPLGRSYAVKQTGNTLDVSSLPSGVYFVSDGHTRAKFVKE